MLELLLTSPVFVPSVLVFSPVLVLVPVSVSRPVLVSMPVSKPVPVLTVVSPLLPGALVETSPKVSIVVMLVVGCVVPPLLLALAVAAVVSLVLVAVVVVVPASLVQARASSAAATAARARTETRGRGWRCMPCGSAARGRLSRVVARPGGCGRVAATMRAYLSHRLLMLPMVLMAAACGEPAPSVAPAPVKALPPMAPAVAPPAEPHGRVFLAASESGLTPVACHLAHVPKFSQGDECLVLMKTGSTARLESGQVTRVTGTGKADCGEGSALVVDAPVDALRGHAIAPVETDFVEVIPPVTPAEADKAASEPLRTRLRAALLGEHPDLAPAKGLQVRQVAQVDLDADGKPETLVVIALPAADADAPPSFSGLYLVPEGEVPVRKLKGQAGAGVQYMLLGALDLDADGRPELWLNTYDDDGFAWSVEKLGSVDMTELGRRRCDG